VFDFYADADTAGDGRQRSSDRLSQHCALTLAAGAAAVCAYRDVSAIKFSGGIARPRSDIVMVTWCSASGSNLRCGHEKLLGLDGKWVRRGYA
jgi:hypothetical protein